MTNYSDVPQINTLYQQQQQVQQAIANIDNGGSLTSIAIGSPPASPGQPPMGMMVGASITLTKPATPETMAAVRAQLVIMSDEITAELAALGVTDAPVTPSSKTPPPAS